MCIRDRYRGFKKDGIAVARNSRSRILVTVVDLCALVNGGQHLFYFVVRVLDGVFFCF